MELRIKLDPSNPDDINQLAQLAAKLSSIDDGPKSTGPTPGKVEADANVEPEAEESDIDFIKIRKLVKAKSIEGHKDTIKNRLIELQCSSVTALEKITELHQPFFDFLKTL